MNKFFFYIIIISQSWLALGTFCAHILNPDHGLIEFVNEEEKNEKEKEIEQEEKKINSNENLANCHLFNAQVQRKNRNNPIFVGRNHHDDFTPPPEFA